MNAQERLVFEGFKLPSTAPFTGNERDWIDMLRCIVGDSDPPPTVLGVQALRSALIVDRRGSGATSMIVK